MARYNYIGLRPRSMKVSRLRPKLLIICVIYFVDGFYIFMETTSKKHRDIAMFYSPIIEQTQTDQVVNVTFWYYMHGIFIQSLKVYVFPDNGDQQLVKAINNEQGKQWKQAVAYLEHMGPFKVSKIF